MSGTGDSEPELMLERLEAGRALVFERLDGARRLVGR